MGLGLLNMGNLINFMSHPVMAGFTTGAALIIGVTQLKYAFGMSVKPPQVGGTYNGEEIDYYYQVFEWWIDNFNGKTEHGQNYRNFYSVRVSILTLNCFFTVNYYVHIYVFLNRFALAFTFP